MGLASMAGVWDFSLHWSCILSEPPLHQKPVRYHLELKLKGFNRKGREDRKGPPKTSGG
jgi:hypothetical protein